VIRYCVRGGGRVLVGFDRHGRARIVVSTARRHRSRRVHRGVTARTLRRSFRRAHRLRGTLYGAGGRPTRRIIFRVRHRRVRFVGVADVRLVRSPRALGRYVRLLGL
jgi:hypothetical protein